MNNYNTHLETLRNSRSLSLKEAAKEIGISRWMLYFYENGYFRPSKKALKKLSDFYGENISLDGDDAYPAPTKEKSIKHEKESLRTKRIVFGSISAAILLIISTGIVLFNKSTNNVESFYGETYNQMRDQVKTHGAIGHDLVTALPYHYVDKNDYAATATIIYYQTDNMLYFNECTYSSTVLNEYGVCRYHISLGSNLGVESNKAEFTFGSTMHSSYFSCYFDYTAKEIDKISDLNIIVKGDLDINESVAIEIINPRIKNIEIMMSALLTEQLGKETSFVNDFLPAREQGRKINFGLQLTGLILILPGIFAFFLFLGLFIRALISNIKPRLVSAEPEKSDKKKEPLPKDFKIEFGIPDLFLISFAKFLQFGSIAFFAISFIAKLGVSFLSFFGSTGFLSFLNIAFLAGVFLEHFVMIGRIKKATTLFRAIVYNLGIFLFVATIETVIIAITNAWGYNLASLVFNNVPSNVYQVVAVHYLIFLFLFFQPSFLSKKSKTVRIIWHSLSLIPLIFLIATYFLSNAYALRYGVTANIFVNFWFPNGFLTLSVVCVLFMYVTFFVRLHYEKKYGQHNAQFFFYGDRYTLYENGICVILIIIAGLVDLAVSHNQYAYYLGVDGNEWILALIPFILLCKYTPNNQQVFLIKELSEIPTRVEENA